MRALTRERRWIERWQLTKLPVKISPRLNYSYTLKQSIYDRLLPRGGKYKFLEIGCSPAAWMIYFHKRYGYEVYGSEYTEIGVEMSRKNLSLQGVKGMVIKDDITNTKLPKNFFDIIYSFGLIEHFRDTITVIKAHVDRLKKGGFAVLITPNLPHSFYGSIQRIVDRQKLEGHIYITSEEIKKHCIKLGMRTLYCGRVGVLNLGLLDVTRYGWLAQKAFSAFDLCAQAVLFALKPRKEGHLSPYFMYIGVKK